MPWTSCNAAIVIITIFSLSTGWWFTLVMPARANEDLGGNLLGCGNEKGASPLDSSPHWTSEESFFGKLDTAFEVQLPLKHVLLITTEFSTSLRKSDSLYSSWRCRIKYGHIYLVLATHEAPSKYFLICVRHFACMYVCLCTICMLDARRGYPIFWSCYCRWFQATM